MPTFRNFQDSWHVFFVFFLALFLHLWSSLAAEQLSCVPVLPEEDRWSLLVPYLTLQLTPPSRSDQEEPKTKAAHHLKTHSASSACTHFREAQGMMACEHAADHCSIPWQQTRCFVVSLKLQRLPLEGILPSSSSIVFKCPKYYSVLIIVEYLWETGRPFLWWAVISLWM